MKLSADQHFYIYSMGKRLRVTAIFHSVDAANAYMERNPDDAVVAEFAPYIFLANQYDSGIANAANSKA